MAKGIRVVGVNFPGFGLSEGLFKVAYLRCAAWTFKNFFIPNEKFLN